MSSNTKPPSYDQTISREDPFALIAPHISIRLYPKLAQVSRKFYNIFMPLLWNDPLNTVRQLGLDPYHDRQWLEKLEQNLPTYSKALRRHIRILDFRNYAVQDVTISLELAFPDLVARLVKMLPLLACVMVGPNVKFDINPMLKALPKLRLLSIEKPKASLSSKVLSNIDNSLLEYIEATSLSNPDIKLPNLNGIRVMKLRENNITDNTITPLLDGLEGNPDIWSLDLSSNKLTDKSLTTLIQTLFQDFDVHSEAYFFVEGRLVNHSLRGHPNFGPFEVIQESRNSCKFNHPDRYFADTPSYRLVTRENAPIRTNGRDVPWDDSLEAMSAIHSRDGGDSRFPPRSITHLNVSQNRITTMGVERLLRESRGFIEVLSCSGNTVRVADRAFGIWKSSDKIMGIFNVAHLLRPVYASNLRHLTIHHSVVTQIPTLESSDINSLVSLWVAEKTLLPRIRITYPNGAFKPDMNPRIGRLTLTHVPRRSRGPLIKALIEFIRLLADQEKNIRKATFSESRRAPIMLRGLRVLRLEMEHDPMQDTSLFHVDIDKHVENMFKDKTDYPFFVTNSSLSITPLNQPISNQFTPSATTPTTQPANESPSSFSPPPPVESPASTAPPADPPSYEVAAALSFNLRKPQSRTEARQAARTATAALRRQPPTYTPSAHSSSPPGYAPTPQTHDDRYVTISSSWGNETYTTKVWAGRTPTSPGSSAAVPAAIQAYTTAALNPSLQQVPGPASPVQIRAGVPEGAMVFHDAWEAGILPTEGKISKPSVEEERAARGMLDVLGALKKWRATKEGREWTGKVEVVTPKRKPVF